MVTIKWCAQHGLELTQPNENMAESYLHMAEESLQQLKGVEQSKIWSATVTYYIFYYSLYALMLRIGVKSEIHSCSLEFMKQYLMQLYNNQDKDMVEKAFSARINLQYYADRPVSDEILLVTKHYCPSFYIKTKDLLAELTEDQIQMIREKLKKEVRPSQKSRSSKRTQRKS